MRTALDKPRKLAHSGLGIATFGIALLAGAGLLFAFSWPEQNAVFPDPIFLAKAMIACGLLAAVAFTLVGTALMVPIAALKLAGWPLALVNVGLFGNQIASSFRWTWDSP